MPHDEAKIAAHDEQIKVLRENDSELFRQLNEVKSEMNNGFNRMADLIGERTKHSPTNWVGIGSMLIAVILLGYNHLATVNKPMQESIKKNAQWVTDRDSTLRTDYVTWGKSMQLGEESANRQDEFEDCMHQLMKQGAANEMAIEMLREHLKAVDNVGSRLRQNATNNE